MLTLSTLSHANLSQLAAGLGRFVVMVCVLVSIWFAGPQLAWPVWPRRCHSSARPSLFLASLSYIAWPVISELTRSQLISIISKVSRLTINLANLLKQMIRWMVM